LQRRLHFIRPLDNVVSIQSQHPVNTAAALFR
jgi:hypothetical protein